MVNLFFYLKIKAMPIPALISLGISAAASAYGAHKKAQASNELREKQSSVNNRMRSLADWYQGEADSDYMETSAAKSTIKRLKDQHRTANKEAESANVKGGGTQEALIATKSKTNEAYNNALSNMVGYGTQYKDSMRRNYAGTLQNLYGNNEHLYGKDVDSWGNLLTGGLEAVGNIAGSTDWSKLGKKTPAVDVGGLFGHGN